ncbi:MAG: hypothetical protein ABI793_13075 [Flavobacterium sp.]
MEIAIYSAYNSKFPSIPSSIVFPVTKATAILAIAIILQCKSSSIAGNYF